MFMKHITIRNQITHVKASVAAPFRYEIVADESASKINIPQQKFLIQLNASRIQ